MVQRRRPKLRGILAAATIVTTIAVLPWQGVSLFAVSRGPKIKKLQHVLMTGQEVHGKVVNVHSASADVAVDGCDLPANLHVAQYKQGSRFVPVDSVFKVGQEVVARVMGFRAGRLELTRVDDPLYMFPVGSEIRGVVTDVLPLSADIAINGTDVPGNFHISEFSKDRSVTAKDVFTVGQEVVARVMEIPETSQQRKAKKIQLGRVDDPKFVLPIGSEVRGRVTKVNPLSADVAIDGCDVPGNCHIAEFSKNRKLKIEDTFPIGQEVVARVQGYGNADIRLTRVDNPLYTPLER